MSEFVKTLLEIALALALFFAVYYAFGVFVTLLQPAILDRLCYWRV